MRNISRRVLVVTAVVALAALVTTAAIAAAASTEPSRALGKNATTSLSTMPSTIVTPTTTASTTTTSPPPTTTEATTTTVPARTLTEGATGADVVALQTRLARLGYWPGNEWGTFGEATAHAVVAFEKATGFARDGIVDAAESRKLAAARRLRPRSSAGRVIEVDLERQIVLDVDNGRVAWVLDASTGSVPGSTPIGQWQVYDQFDGWMHGDLGVLYRPKFFSGNVGVHGSPSVPAYPASHGCVRVFNGAMDWLWASDHIPMGTAVWVY